MGKQKLKKGPAHKLPKKRHAEARALAEPEFRPRVVRQVPRTDRQWDQRFDEELDLE